MNKNSTNYPEVLYEKLKELNDDPIYNEDKIKQNLFNYQQGVYNYMTKTDQRGILLYHSVGSGKCMKIDTPILMYDGSIKKIQDIQIGDVIISSGLGGIFPKGMVVGEIVRMEKGEDNFFMDIAVEPIADLKKIEEVLIITGNNELIPPTL